MADAKPESAYDSVALQYDEMNSLPQFLLVNELVSIALGDCSGKVILDLGGGTGIHARRAVEQGATRVDNVDFSQEMLRSCEEEERRASRKPGEKIACFQGDATRSLSHLDLPGRDDTKGLYDIVMMNWTFDHATTLDELKAMWSNVSKHGLTGGQLISVRTRNPDAGRASVERNYGVTISNVKPITDGLAYDFTIHTENPFTLPATSMHANHNLDQARAIAKVYGFPELEVVPVTKTKVVAEKRKFWEAFVENPALLCVVGTKVER